MDDFVFGSLSTDEKRIAYLKEKFKGVKHGHRLQPAVPKQTDSPVVTATVEVNWQVARVECVMLTPQTAPASSRSLPLVNTGGQAVYPMIHNKTEWDLLNWTYYQQWQVSLPPQPNGTLVRYQIKAYPANGDEPVLADDGEVFSYLVGDPSPPEWSREAIVYQIFPDRFNVGNGRSWNKTETLNDIYGGTLRGIIEKLDYIADMGFNSIWLNPFFPDNSHHGYHATDYFSVNPRLGTMEDIRELVQIAHAKGIRLLLDFVANHWGSQHHTFQEAIKDSGSPFVEWYNWIDYPHDYETFFGVMDLPQVNVNHPDVRDYLLRSVRFWLADVGFDGLRLDYALGPTHDFWTAMRTAVKQLKPDAWIFGEVVETPSTILSYAGRLDGCIDFPLMQAMRDTFAVGTMSLTQFDTFLNNHEHFFPDNFSRPSFLDNHDMNRFSFLAQGDSRQLKVAALCQFTLSGPPFIYNGTEVGVQQELSMNEQDSQGMEECRQPMLWGDAQDGELRDYFQWLIQFRRAHPVLWRGQRRTVHLDEISKTYAYLRYDENEWVLIGLNLSCEPQTFTINDLPHGDAHTFTLPTLSGDVYDDKRSF